MFKLSVEQIDAMQIHYIVAGPRTGSTLLSTMLNHHSQIISPFEESFAYNLYFKYHKYHRWDSDTINRYVYDFYLFSDWNILLQFCKREEFVAVLEKYKDALNFERVIKLTYLCFHPQKDKSQITHIVDKQLKIKDYWPQMARFYPKSKFILLYRDPMDNVPRVTTLRRKKLDPSTTLVKEMIHFNEHYGALLKAKGKLGDEKVMIVKYEDLILNVDRVLEQICIFIGKQFEAAMLSYHEEMKNAIAEVSVDDLNEVLKKEISHSLDVHKGLLEKPNADKIGEWKSTLLPDEADRIWYYCGETGTKMGYSKDNQIQIPHHKKRLHYFLRSLSFLCYRLVITTWYKLPFSCWYWIKKIKYHRHIQKRTFFK